MSLEPLPPSSRLDRMPGRAPTDFVLGGSSRRLIYLIHGVTGTPVEMRYLALGLARTGCDVYVTTLPGHCGRLRDLVQTTEVQWREHVKSQLSFALEQYDAVYAAGLSAGGLLALEASLHLPLAGIGVLSPTFFYDGWNTPWHHFLLPLFIHLVPSAWQQLLFHVDGPPFGIKDEWLQDQVRSAYRPAAIFREWLGVWRRVTRDPQAPGSAHASASKGHPVFPLRTLAEVDRLIRRVRGTLSQVTAPTMILQAKEDDMTSPRNATLVYDGISSKQKQVVLLDDCYHVITVDKQKKTVVSHLSDFFNLPALHPGLRPSIPEPS